MQSDDVNALNAEILRLREELGQTKEISQKYLQNVAHQLTAPLGAIKWSIEALKDEAVPLIRKKELLSSVYSQATILVHLIKNFTLLSNLEADHELGQFREKPDATDIVRLAINLANDFQPQAYDVQKGIQVDAMSFEKSIGTKKLMIEKNLVAQAMSNLLENAVKYADKDTVIWVSAEMKDQFSVAVTSTGIPVTDEEKSHLFDRGFRGRAAKQQVPAGTGIGLYLASRVMTMHGGRISLETEKRMSRFLLSFPMTRVV